MRCCGVIALGLGLGIALGVGGCAGGAKSLRGDTEGTNVALHVAAALDGAAARVSLEVENRAEDAIGVDVDAIRLRDHAGRRYAALGLAQRFVRRGGEAVVRRVPHGAVNVSPGTKQMIALEFEQLPAEEASYSLVVPALYRLSIEGQVGLKAIRVPLRVSDEAAPAGGFYDPFEE